MKNQIIALIAEAANRAANDFTIDHTLEDDLAIDALDGLALQCALEDEFEIALDDEAWQRCYKVQDVIDLVGQELAMH